MKKKKEKNWNKNKNPKEQEQEQKIQNPQDYFLISPSLFLSLSEFLSFSHTLSSLPQIGVAQIAVVWCLLMGSRGSPWVRWL